MSAGGHKGQAPSFGEHYQKQYEPQVCLWGLVSQVLAGREKKDVALRGAVPLLGDFHFLLLKIFSVTQFSHLHFLPAPGVGTEASLLGLDRIKVQPVPNKTQCPLPPEQSTPGPSLMSPPGLRGMRSSMPKMARSSHGDVPGRVMSPHRHAVEPGRRLLRQASWMVRSPCRDQKR